MQEEYYNKDGSISLIDKDVDEAILKCLENNDKELNENSNQINFIGGMLLGGLFTMILCAIFTALLHKYEINKDPIEDLNYKHYTMEQHGYYYCPYCGKELPEKIDLNN